MLQTLVYIPHKLFGLPLFGVGLLLAVWAAASAAILGWQWLRHGAKAAGAYLPVLAMFGVIIWKLLPMLEEHTPAGEVRGLPIRGYGVMVMLGVVLSVALAVYRAAQRRIDPEFIYSLALWGFLGGIAGARAFYVIEYWDQFYVSDAGHINWLKTLGNVVNIPQGGLVIYGSWIGGGLAGVLFTLRKRLPVLVLSDVIAPSLMLGLAIGRIGCFLNGCCYGSQCNLPWSVQFPPQSPPYQRQLARAQFYLHGLAFPEGMASQPVISAVEPGSAAEKAGLKPGDEIVGIAKLAPGDAKPQTVFPIEKREDSAAGIKTMIDHSLSAAELALLGISGDGTRISIAVAGRSQPAEWTITRADVAPARSLPVHPTQLYSAIDAALLCLLLLAFEPWRRWDGQTIALLLTLHPIARFLVEAIRTDEPKKFWGMSISQVVSLVTLMLAGALWGYLWRSWAASPARPQVTAS